MADAKRPAHSKPDPFPCRQRRRLQALARSPSKAAAAAPSSAAAAASDDEVQIGDLEGSYERIKKLGEGAFGVVTKERHLRTGELVAVKSVRGGGGVEAAAPLKREAAMLSACRGNPVVAALREVVTGRPGSADLHLVMEYAGPSLHDVAAKRRRLGDPFSEAETRHAMRRLLAGVGMMHAAGVVHRGLKPGNVLVGDRDGRLKICDLGLARTSADPPIPGGAQPEGTLGYMVPEVLLSEEGRRPAPPVDVWALGCVMAELAAGRPLFAADNEYEQLVEIVRLLGVPDDVSRLPLDVSGPSELRAAVPEELLSDEGFDVLRRLLEFDPGNRITADGALRMPWFHVFLWTND